jgi:hypothetical protein
VQTTLDHLFSDGTWPTCNTTKTAGSTANSIRVLGTKPQLHHDLLRRSRFGGRTHDVRLPGLAHGHPYVRDNTPRVTGWAFGDNLGC